MRNMISKLLMAPIVMAAAAMVPNAAVAQSVKVAQVPFNFVVEGHMCPAGRYVITRAFGGTTVELASTTHPIHYIWNLQPGDPSPNDSKVLLTFDVQGQNRMLRTVQYAGMITYPIDARRFSKHYDPDLVVPGE